MLSSGPRKKNSAKLSSLAFGHSPFAIQSSSAVVVTVNTIAKSKAATSTLAASATVRAVQSPTPSAFSSSSRPTPEKEPPRRKRPASQSELPEGPRAKKQKSKNAAKESSTPRSSRASSIRRIGPPFGSLERPIPRICVTTEDGAVPHVSSEDVVIRVLREQTVPKKTKKGYRAFFRNPSDLNDKSFEPDSLQLPIVEFQYPNHGASERFLLLYPWDKDDYQPVKELMRTLSTIVDCYLTPAQREPFGSLSRNLISIPTEDTRPASPANHGTPSEQSTPLLRILERAYHKHDGPLFIKTMNEVSSRLATLKEEMMENARAWFNANKTDEEAEEGTSSGGVPVKLWKMVLEETYQRSVGPDVDDTKKYRSFSSETYGELNPSFISDIVHRLGLKPGKVFVDLGSGVGNCVFQAALQSGCDAYGIEINHPVASLSFKQKVEFTARLRMWGLTAGKYEVLDGDFCESNEVAEWIRKADVVLVNNYIFNSELNDRLTWRFLDLRDGAKVVVLKPFWPFKRPLTGRTADTPEAVLTNVEKLEYFSDSVSWTKEPGDFYIYTKSSVRPVLVQESRTSSRASSRLSR
ncbi:histone methylation protein DOT1-domain-containing protein [Cantharellus anzutake]|uniref:histone methylation protein DOT1-domain-containing protein n=1 Tax=Cantharellus anzutake TaxID=1750568 RepID=UPI00190405FB|nr:histone methylation protein DOT1-domain-containing protein [Cantharellus anzutake]KAF8330438.1 histone methylation protein DOT1-domain-containing protein [Cantharellus anzutake]